MKNTNSICWRHKTATSFSHLVAEIVFVFLIVYLTGSSSDFKAFGAAIKAARNEYGESRKKVSDELYISPRYLANIENKGQQPSLQVFYDLVTRYHISVDQFFFPNSNAEKSTGRRQLDALLDGMSDKGIRIVFRAVQTVSSMISTISSKRSLSILGS